MASRIVIYLLITVWTTCKKENYTKPETIRETTTVRVNQLHLELIMEKPIDVEEEGQQKGGV